MKRSTAGTSRLGVFCLLFPVSLLAIEVVAVRAAQAPVAAPASELLLGLDADKSKINWTLDTTLHTVHGTFKFKSGELRLDPSSGKASGQIVVAATSGDSGNEGRDKKMHGDVLESAHYQDIVFKADRVEGKVAPSGSSNIMLHGVMTLHGADHEFGIPIQAELSGDHWKATAKFSIPFLKWGLKNPSNWILKVKPDVNIESEITGTVKTAPAN